MLQTLRRLQASLRSDERGASLVEYALLMALIVVVCIGAVTFFGTSNRNSAQSSADCIKAAYAGSPPPAGCE